MNRRNALAATFALIAAAASGAENDEQAIRQLYADFVAAQNARDLPRVRALLLDSPRFLWISDGKPFWGPDAMIERMGAFQKADVWKVTPDLGRARVVDVSPLSAFLHQPLKLTLGPAAAPNTISFLVHVLCSKTSQGWRIAALFTTEEIPV